jgi:hypothetical protein
MTSRANFIEVVKSLHEQVPPLKNKALHYDIKEDAE